MKIRGSLPIALLVLALAPQAGHARVKGDLNDDGLVDSGDALLLVRIAKGEIAPSSLGPDAILDVGPVVNGVGGDQNIDLADALCMLQAMSTDVDADTLLTPSENAIGTSPFLADTDIDGWSDPTDPQPLVVTAPSIPFDPRVFDGPTNVSLNWNPPNGDVDHYLIHRYGNDGTYEFFTASSGQTPFVDTTASSGVVYRYWIQAVNRYGQEAQFVNCSISDPGNTRPWITGGLGPIPNPFFTATGGPGTISLAWEQSPEPSVTGYKIWTSTSSVPLGTTAGLTLAATAPGGGTTAHQLSDLTSGLHYVRITAVSALAESSLASAKQLVVAVN
jgi:hypothetical protein